MTVNFIDRNGNAIDHRTIESEAGKNNISLRTGCFCNPGAGEIALGISRVELDVCFTQPGHESRLSLDDFRLCIDGKNSGAVRISIGLVTNFQDVQAFLDSRAACWTVEFAAGDIRQPSTDFLTRASTELHTVPLGGHRVFGILGRHNSEGG